MKKVSERIENRKNMPEKSYHVAIASIGQRVLSVASNSATGHAETTLLEQLSLIGTSEEVDITVVRVANTSKRTDVLFKNSRPCVECSAALASSRFHIRRIGWSTSYGSLVYVDRQAMS